MQKSNLQNTKGLRNGMLKFNW